MRPNSFDLRISKRGNGHLTAPSPATFIVCGNPLNRGKL